MRLTAFLCLAVFEKIQLIYCTINLKRYHTMLVKNGLLHLVENGSGVQFIQRKAFILPNNEKGIGNFLTFFTIVGIVHKYRLA